MAPTYGSAPKCQTCSKSVYFAEQQSGPGGKIYHKGCLKCLSCSKSLDAFALVDREGEPYCKACYGKLFGAKGYNGPGGSLVGDYVAASPPPSSPQQPQLPTPTPPTLPSRPLIPPKPKFVTVTQPTPPSYQPQPPALPPRTSVDSAGASESIASGSSGGGQAARSWATPVIGSASARTVGVGAGKDLCRRCGQVAYAAESVLAAGQKWHKRCLRCAGCSTALSSHLTEKDGLPWCKKCYDQNFGIQSQGLMTRPQLY